MGDFAEREHMRNLKALRDRCADVDNNLHRKKNRFDPLNNPVKLFRKTDEEAKKVNLDSY